MNFNFNKKFANCYLISILFLVPYSANAADLDNEQYLKELEKLWRDNTPVCKEGLYYKYDSIAECILDSMSGVDNDRVANIVMNECREKSRCRMPKTKHSNTFFGPKDSKQCVLKYAKETSSAVAAGHIYRACHQLY